MGKIFVVIKDSNYKYSGEFISEDSDSITIDEIKNGRIVISKDVIAIRGVSP